MVGAVGAGLMYTVTASASNGAVIGYQILVGVSTFPYISYSPSDTSRMTDLYRHNSAEHPVRHAG
jgi:hypothetical protein